MILECQICNRFPCPAETPCPWSKRKWIHGDEHELQLGRTSNCMVPYSNWIQSFPFGGKFISMIAGVVSLPCICNLSLVSLVLLKEVLHIPETLVKQSLS